MPGKLPRPAAWLTDAGLTPAHHTPPTFVLPNQSRSVAAGTVHYPLAVHNPDTKRRRTQAPRSRIQLATFGASTFCARPPV